MIMLDEFYKVEKKKRWFKKINILEGLCKMNYRKMKKKRIFRRGDQNGSKCLSYMKILTQKIHTAALTSNFYYKLNNLKTIYKPEKSGHKYVSQRVMKIRAAVRLNLLFHLCHYFQI